MVNDFETLLKDASDYNLEIEISNYTADLEDTYTEVNLVNDDFEMLSEKLLLLPSKGIFILFSKFCFRLTFDEIETFFNIDQAKGWLIHYRKLLSVMFGCQYKQIISDSSMEEVCKLALKKYMDKELYEADHRTVTYRPKIIIFMRKLSKRVAVVICILVMTFSASMVVNADFREKVLLWIVESFEKNSIFELKNGRIQTIEDLQLYSPAYIPSRYKLVEVINQQSVILYEYVSDNSDKMTVFMSLANSKTYIDTESVSVEEIEMNDFTAYHFLKDDMQYLVFEKDGYTFIVYGSITKSELLEIAENIRKK